jgi:hypothetical protein
MANYAEIPDLKISELAQIMIFKNLWHFLPNKSIVSGLWLRTYVNTPLWSSCFLHVLNHEKYRYFRFYYKNIVLCSPGERGLWLQGSEEERIQYALTIEEKTRGKQTADWSKLKALELILKEEYKKYFPSTKGMFLNYQYTLQEQGEIIGKLNKRFLNELN